MWSKHAGRPLDKKDATPYRAWIEEQRIQRQASAETFADNLIGEVRTIKNVIPEKPDLEGE